MIAGAGFAMMAWRLARTRVGLQPNFGHPLSRERANDPDMFNPASREYYRIIDNAQVGWYDTPNGMTCYL